VGQFVAHHLRSLELASRGQLGDALLEHAFAIHFLEDAFSAGHLVMNDMTWANGNTRTRRRHDFFNAAGLRVRRALSAEPCDLLEQSFEAGLPPCWTTTGDGYLGLARDSSDRVHVVRAVKKAQFELAMALDTGRVVEFAETLGAREQMGLGDLVDPMPWWTVPRRDRRLRPAIPRHSAALLRGAARAVQKLRDGPPLPQIVIGVPAPAGMLDAQTVADILDPCGPRSPVAPTMGDPGEDEDGCGSDKTLRVGQIGTSLVRPILVELPAAQDDVTKLQGEAATDHGLAFQLLASVGSSALFPSGLPAEFFAPSAGVSTGLAYRFGNYLPGRRNRAAVEISLGFSTALHVDVNGRAGGHPLVTMLEQEVRWPILWEILTSYALPLDLTQSHRAGSVIVLGGARVRETLTPAPRIWGIEHELLAIALSRGVGAYPLYSASPEVRLHLGFADPSAGHPGLAPVWGPTLSLTLIGGSANFF